LSGEGEGENSSLRKVQKSIQKSVLGTRVIEVCQKKKKEEKEKSALYELTATPQLKTGMC
jgi:hypothetical protein